MIVYDVRAKTAGIVGLCFQKKSQLRSVRRGMYVSHPFLNSVDRG